MERQTFQSATVYPFPRGGLAPSCLSPTADCARLAMTSALAGFGPRVSGRIEHGRAFLSGDVATDAERRLIERSVLRLHCAVDVINDIVVRQVAPVQATSPSRLSHDIDVARPIIFLSAYCSLRQDALESAIAVALSTLMGELHGSDGPLAEEAYIFYYGWHGDAAIIDIAIPATDALERRRGTELRSSVLPTSKRCTAPSGGISGLRAARRRLRLAAAADVSDQLFRVWQCVPLHYGNLPKAWLSATLYCAD